MRMFGKAGMGLVLVAMTAMPMVAQRDGYQNRDGYNNRGSYQDRNGYNNRGGGYNAQYDQGLQRGYHGNNGGYNDQYDHRHYDSRDEYNRTHGGIGPGKGALIGGAGGAVLGALFGGGLKGAIIGGGAGAGVGAIAGKVHQDNKQNDWRDYRDGR